MCDIARRKDDGIPSTKPENKSWLKESEFASSPVAERDHNAEYFIPTVSMASSRDCHVDHKTAERMSNAALIQRQLCGIYRYFVVFFRMQFFQL